MPTEAKQAQVAELVEVLAAVDTAIVSDHRGLTVADLRKVRRQLRERDIEFRVVKNRLARIAAEQAGRSELVPLLTGPSALVTGGGEETALAKGLLDALRPYRGLEVRGAAIRGTTYDAADVTRLATLPPRETLLAQLAGGMASPLSTMAGLLAAPLRNLGYGLAQLRDQREAAAADRRHHARHSARHHSTKENRPMATLTTDQILEAIDGMTVLELSTFIKAFEERYGVTAAAPAAAAAAPRRGGRRRGGRRRGADRVLGRPHRGRPEQDPGHQGRPRADRPRPQGGQGPRRRRAQADQGRRRPRRGRQGQGRARGAGRQGRDQVATDARGLAGEPARTSRPGREGHSRPLPFDVPASRAGLDARFARIGYARTPAARAGSAPSSATAPTAPLLCPIRYHVSISPLPLTVTVPRGSQTNSSSRSS